MSMEEIAKKIREQYPDDWNIFVDGDGVLCIHSPRELTPEQSDALTDTWYRVTAEMPRPWESTYHVTLDDALLLDKAILAAKKYGLKLVPTDTENTYQVLVDDTD